jgi:hypothetical protein
MFIWVQSLYSACMLLRTIFFQQYNMCGSIQRDACHPANGLGGNSFNELDFALGLFRLGATRAGAKIKLFGLGSSFQQFGVNLVRVVTI